MNIAYGRGFFHYYYFNSILTQVLIKFFFTFYLECLLFQKLNLQEKNPFWPYVNQRLMDYVRKQMSDKLAPHVGATL